MYVYIDSRISGNELILLKPSTNIVVELKMTTCDAHVSITIAIRDTWYAQLSDSLNRNGDLVIRGRDTAHDKHESRSRDYKSFTLLCKNVKSTIVNFKGYVLLQEPPKFILRYRTDSARRTDNFPLIF